MQAFRSHHQHFGDELIKAVIDQHVGDFITSFGDGLIPCHYLGGKSAPRRRRGAHKKNGGATRRRFSAIREKSEGWADFAPSSARVIFFF